MNGSRMDEAHFKYSVSQNKLINKNKKVVVLEEAFLVLPVVVKVVTTINSIINSY